MREKLRSWRKVNLKVRHIAMRKIKITDANSNDKLKQWLNKSQQRIIINEKIKN